ncbi:hypothetical protein D3C86_2216580 [compost metagenome]
MRLAELRQHLGQREPVGHHHGLVQQGRIVQLDRLVFQDALEQVLGIHVADHMIDVTVADRVG